MEIIILIVTNILAPIITGIATWLMAKKKYNAEVDNTVISNMKQSLEFYKALSDDNKARLEDIQAKNARLEQEISELKTKLVELSMSICLDLSCKYRAYNKSAKNEYTKKGKKAKVSTEKEDSVNK